MCMADDEVRAAAIEFAKRNKMRIARELTDLKTFTLSEHPISVFMAGSPGAGKTEDSKSLISLLEEEGGRRVIRIDGDEGRSFIPGSYIADCGEGTRLSAASKPKLCA